MKTTRPKTTSNNQTRIVREQAIERAIDIYGFILLNYIRRLIRDFHVAEDILQELWLKVYDDFEVEQFMHLPLLKWKARQLVIDESRKRAVRNFIDHVDELPETDGSYIFHETASKEQEQALWNTFWSNFNGADITDNQKDAFWLKERYGYNIYEISEHLKVPTSTLQDWINKVKREGAKLKNQESI